MKVKLKIIISVFFISLFYAGSSYSADTGRATVYKVTMEELGRQTVIAHNDYSPRRERVLRLFEEKHAAINIQISLASLDGIKRAVEMGLGVALLPRRCALSEIARKQLAAVRVPQLGMPRDLRLVYRRTGEASRAASAFLDAARTHASEQSTA